MRTTVVNNLIKCLVLTTTLLYSDDRQRRATKQENIHFNNIK